MTPPARAVPGGDMDEMTLVETLRSTTRPIHKRLNRLIMCRMPMALPPRASDPSIYATGLLYIAPIYMTFEALWQSVLTPPGDGPDNPSKAEAPQGSDSAAHDCPVSLEAFTRPAITLKLGLALLKLAIPGLRRTPALRRDLERLTGWSPTELDAEIRRVVTSDGSLRDFTTRIRDTLEKRPHVLVSYAYVFYMALFAGGRIIRSTLESQDHSFWDGIPVTPVKPRMLASEQDPAGTGASRGPTAGRMPEEAVSRNWSSGAESSTPVNFLKFDTPSDGEDLKEEFKGRLRDSESLLTETEREDIIQEATVIFEEMLSVVEQLDLLFEPDKPSDAVAVASGSFDETQQSKITDKLRDSVVVTKERQKRKDARSNREVPDQLPALGEQEDEDWDSEDSPKGIRFSKHLEHVPAAVVVSPEAAGSGPMISSLDGADDDLGGATEKDGLLRDTRKQDLGHEAEEGWDIRNKTLRFFVRAVIVATFTWMVMLLTAMLLGRSEPFRKGCPNFNPYNH